jgi:hypothetical protein
MCLRRAPEKYIAGAALDRAGLDIRLIDDDKVVSPMHRPCSTPQTHYFSVSGTHLCQRLSKPQGLVRPEGSSALKKSCTSLGLELATFRLVP